MDLFTQTLLRGAAGGGGASKPYVEDFFGTAAWKGNETARTISTGVNAARGSLAWVKSRNDTHDYHLVDTVRGANQLLYSNSSAVQSNTANRITAFTNDGYTLGTAGQVNGTSAYNYAGWNFRKKEGFFDIVTYTGTGSDLNVDCGFSAGARFVLIKRSNGSGDWYYWDHHRGIVAGDDPYALLNSSAASVTNTDYIDPLNAGFTVTSSAPAGLNNSGSTYIFLAIA